LAAAAILAILGLLYRRLSRRGKERAKAGELQSEVSSPPLPSLALRLFPMTDRKYQDIVVFNQSSAPSRISPSRLTFGFALENLENSTLAQGIDIRVEFWWRGNEIQCTPHFAVHRRSEGWRADNNTLTYDKPAVLTFHGTELERCPFGQPLEWYNFTLSLKERIDGHFLVTYKVSSARPKTQKSGELKIVMT